MTSLVPGMSQLIQDSYKNFTKHQAYLKSVFFCIIVLGIWLLQNKWHLRIVFTFILCVTQQEFRK